MALPDGLYTIISSLTRKLASKEEGNSAVVIVPSFSRNPGMQDWIIQHLGNGNVTIKNSLAEEYLSYEGEPADDKLVETKHEPREWRLQRSSEPKKFHIVVPGGPVDGVELAFDLDFTKVYPARTALHPLQPNNHQTAWLFRRK